VQAWGCVSCSVEVGRNTLDSVVAMKYPFVVRASGAGDSAGPFLYLSPILTPH
jgi:hypothetical protein